MWRDLLRNTDVDEDPVTVLDPLRGDLPFWDIRSADTLDAARWDAKRSADVVPARGFPPNILPSGKASAPRGFQNSV
jgi:hypothetical protein